MLADVPLICPHYISISRRTKQVDISFKTKTRGAIQHLAIDATGFKVEWQIKKYGTDGKPKVWRKLHIIVDTSTHEIIEVSGDSAYDTRACYDTIKYWKKRYSYHNPHSQKQQCIELNSCLAVV